MNEKNIVSGLQLHMAKQKIKIYYKLEIIKCNESTICEVNS